MLSGKSLEVVFTVFIVSIVLRETFGEPPGLALLLLLVLLTLLAIIIWFRGVIKPGRIPILRHGAHVCEKGL